MSAVCGLECTAQAQTQAQPGAASATPPRFEAASVKLMLNRDKLPMDQQLFSMTPPGAPQFRARNITLSNLIAIAFKLDGNNQLSGKPDWLDSTFYEVAAKPEGDAGLSYEQLRPLLQQLLQERFHLAYHRENKNIKSYALVVAKGGPKLQASKGESTHAYILPGALDAANMSVYMLASMLSRPLGQPVADRTGLKGNYDFRLDFAPLEETDTAKPSIFTAVEEQLGLKLETGMVPIEMFVIDHVDKVPTEN